MMMRFMIIKRGAVYIFNAFGATHINNRDVVLACLTVAAVFVSSLFLWNCRLLVVFPLEIRVTVV